jgi:hypothetical protein
LPLPPLLSPPSAYLLLEDKSRSIQAILTDMKAELSKEEASLGGLKEVSEKLRKEAEHDELWRVKYQQEVC